MTLKEKKEEFLNIETWEEFDRRRLEFAGLKMTDKEVSLLSSGTLPGYPGVIHSSFVTQPPDLLSWFYAYHGLRFV